MSRAEPVMNTIAALVALMALLGRLSSQLQQSRVRAMEEQVAHAQPVSGTVVLGDTANAFFYTVAALAAAILIFERRNLK